MTPSNDVMYHIQLPTISLAISKKEKKKSISSLNVEINCVSFISEGV